MLGSALHAGLIAALVNLALMFGLSSFGERVERKPMCNWLPDAEKGKRPANPS